MHNMLKNSSKYVFFADALQPVSVAGKNPGYKQQQGNKTKAYTKLSARVMKSIFLHPAEWVLALPFLKMAPLLPMTQPPV
ncbi:hypothetical protein C7N43_29105 [Sphingobacteriales bacterium UPWRP_1]|nr:hypothetical protein BVG80_03725 [Sphingobacteriales bacterium TSM_CSM]PSJ73442.1 hypothetical protein C7N43_29105 [Sphingobacteriales bacterium UPWRP_1]